MTKNVLCDVDKIKALIENTWHSTTQEIAEKLNTSHTLRDFSLE